MDFDGVSSVVCDAEESDWLDVSYSERNYVEQDPEPRKARRNFNIKITKPVKIAAIALLCVALLAALLFVDGKFAKDVFQTAKAAYSTSVFTLPQQKTDVNVIEIPSNLDLVEVADGVASFTGGRAALSFTDGKVTAVGEGTVTVAVDDELCIVYSQLTDIYVAVGDEVSVNSLLAKYSDTFCATLTVGDAVADVVGSETQLTWNV